MKAYMFPGQGSQFTGMGKDCYDSSPSARALFDKANAILRFDITQTMFYGTDEDLKKTSITQPAIFIHSVAVAHTTPAFEPAMVAGHSLGEFSALVACRALSFEEGLTLVAKRAQAMQKACVINPSTMAAIVGLDSETVEEICQSIDEIVVPANYNCPGQIVISGSIKGVEEACKKCKEANAKRALPLSVGGAFHSPLMQPACQELNTAIDNATFATPICPIYQNTDAMPHTAVNAIKENIKKQLTAPVKWHNSIKNMVKDGGSEFIECGPGNVLRGLLRKITAPTTQR